MNARTQDTAARRYRIERYLTEGGMGAIYLGKKLGSGGFEKEVVLKQLLPEYTSRPEFRDLFFREARISATLDHANIVHTFDLVESDQSLFIVMEYVRGADLRTIVRRARQRRCELSPAAAVHIALGILAGLSYAHTRRDAAGKSLDIIHRDVSPSNIICSVQGEAKLSDFGIARAATHSSVFYRVRGKVGYMSPEQARNQPIDHRCDLFSLAVCLYESLSGERLFVGDLTTPADEIYGRPVPPLSQRRPGIPATLDAVLARALAANIEHRYASAAELADTLRTVAHHSGLTLSAPELAAHLHQILGDDPSRWLRAEPRPDANNETPNVPEASIGLVGKEAASIGIVRETREDQAPPAVVNDGVVSGRKTFDIDSMLNDEATRPGGALSRGEAKSHADEPTTSETTRRTAAPMPPIRASHTPPPVWTRDSGPVHVGTSASGEVKDTRAPPASGPTRSLTPGKLPVLPPPPSPPFPKRSLPRAGPHAMKGPAVAPPPFVPPAPPLPPLRATGRLSVPPPPPLPPTSSNDSAAAGNEEFEEATPFPGVEISVEVSSGPSTGDTTVPHAQEAAQFPTVDSSDEPTRALGPGLASPSSPPPLSDLLPARELLPPPSSHPLLPPASGMLPPVSLHPLLSPASTHLPLPSPEPTPLVEPLPRRSLARGSTAASLARGGGPPRLLQVAALLASALGGAYLASRMTARDVDGAVASQTGQVAAVALPLAPAGPDEEARAATAPAGALPLPPPANEPAADPASSAVAEPADHPTARSTRHAGPTTHKKHRNH